MLIRENFYIFFDSLQKVLWVILFKFNIYYEKNVGGEKKSQNGEF